MKQPLLESLSLSDEFPSPPALNFQTRTRARAPFRDIAFDFANTLKAFNTKSKSVGKTFPAVNAN
jgi:hypothetical protein